MWFKIRDISVSDRLRSRCRPGDRVAQAISVDTVDPPTRDFSFDSPPRVNSLVHAEIFRFAGECELADGWRPYPAGR
jgi:hypothetical protein